MGEGEHTIIGRIARERLNQIASRKLSTLGVPVRLGADRETLEGELGFASGRVAHPITGQTISRARFVVSGHDKLTFLDPPLAALGRVPFYEHDRLLAFEAAVAAALAALHGQLDDVAARLRALRLEVTVDPERLQLRAVVKAPGHAFEIIGGGEGARVARVAPVGDGRRRSRPASRPSTCASSGAGPSSRNSWSPPWRRWRPGPSSPRRPCPRPRRPPASRPPRRRATR